MARKSEPMAFAERSDTNYYKSYTRAKEIKCDQCKETFIRYVNEMDYIQKIGEKTFEFCSYNCRSKFRKEHEQEILDDKNKLDPYEKLLQQQRYYNDIKRGAIKPRKGKRGKNGYKCYVDGVEYDSMITASKAVFGFGEDCTIARARDYRKQDEFEFRGHHIKVVKNDEIS